MNVQEFVIHHDNIRPFIIFYVLISALIALFLGLLYFLLWVLVHIILEIYKRRLLFGGLGMEDFLLAIKHARVDLFFFFLGLSVDVLAHSTFSLAPGRLVGIIRSEEALGRVSALARFVGTAKATKSAVQIYEEVSRKGKKQEPERFAIDLMDIVLFSLSVALIGGAISILSSIGYTDVEIIHLFLYVLIP